MDESYESSNSLEEKQFWPGISQSIGTFFVQSLLKQSFNIKVDSSVNIILV